MNITVICNRLPLLTDHSALGTLAAGELYNPAICCLAGCLIAAVTWLLACARIHHIKRRANLAGFRECKDLHHTRLKQQLRKSLPAHPGDQAPPMPSRLLQDLRTKAAAEDLRAALEHETETLKH